ncbi:unc-43 [Symbiodinium sp. CCMP2456]|nr:unc-43 [Symbiodinium sp. CCMP2456]
MISESIEAKPVIKQSVSSLAADVSRSLTTTCNIWDEYNLVEELGSGSFGVVRAVTHRGSKQRYAAKTVRLTEKPEPEMMLVSLEHPHILQLKQIVEDGGERHLILDLCTGGDLEKWIENRYDEDFEGTRFYDQPSTSTVFCLAEQMFSAIAYLHERSVVHRDVKPPNWMLACRSLFPKLKLSDFGLACECPAGEVLKEKCGSPPYMAPEVFERSYTALCDVWSTGLVVHDIAVGAPLFHKIPEPQLEEHVLGLIELTSPTWRYHKPYLKAFVAELLQRETEGRPSSLEALQNARQHGAKCSCIVS